ncbi:MAG TPA: 1-acyl-sn-glycerol-3-phosphate acyltransferase [Phycicoccus sp.]|nr:1-acyl-sn-glycerol-3-phosphate acyltransferase [Phycicoccus sp.]
MAKQTPGRATDALAAGAARAGGERAKRRSTPLLSVVEDPDTRAETARAARPFAVPTGPTPTADPTAEVTTGTKATTPTSATSRARRRPSAPEAGGIPDATVSEIHATSGDGIPAEGTAATDRRKHRPKPEILSEPTPTARQLTGERRVPRLSPRAKRAAADATEARLRLAPPLPDADGEASAGTDAPTPQREAGEARRPAALAPAPVSGGGLSVPGMPSVEEVVQGIITFVRVAAQASGMSPQEVERRLATALAYLRRRVEGDYHVDEFGYDADFTTHVVLPLLRPIYRNWFRVEVRGVEHLPTEGGGLIVANHSGTIAIDSVMLQVAVHDETPTHRVMRALGADLVFSTPFLGTYARRTGSTLATNTDAEGLFERGELVGVFPEGFKGIGKPFKERYKLQRFGRGGFVAAALKAGVPIIPTSIVGAEEVAPIIGNMSTVARVLGLPYAPITPTFPWLGLLGLIPLPSKWIIEFGAPIATDGFGPRAEEDPMLVFDLTDQVRETIQQTLYALLMRRTSVFF